MVFYAAFNSISVLSRRKLKIDTLDRSLIRKSFTHLFLIDYLYDK